MAGEKALPYYLKDKWFKQVTNFCKNHNNTMVDFPELTKRLTALDELSGKAYEFSPSNVYQKGCATNRKVIGQIVDELMLPGSRIENPQALLELFERSRSGESCLLLGEHYSNFDYPLFYRLVERTPILGERCAEQLLPVRGMKLSESVHMVAQVTRSYDTIVIYPSRTLDKINNPVELSKVKKISVPMNHAAIKAIVNKKHNGKVIMVFPAGTRYRPWDLESKKGVREIYSYLKIFDNLIFMAINGNVLPPHRSENMLKDSGEPDLVLLTCSPVIDARNFRKEVLKSNSAGSEPRQFVVDSVMKKLFDMHDEIEPLRLAEKEKMTT